MCTATWIRDDEGYQLFFNRDEKFTRKAGIPPEARIANGVRFVSPGDGDFGGTWIAVNEFGISVCLLNGAVLTGSGDRSTGHKSRGLLIPDVIGEGSSDAVCARILESDLRDFSPFTVAVLSSGRQPALIEWNGAAPTYVRDGDRLIPLTSSSFLSADVRAHRRAHLDSLRESGPLQPEDLRRWHAGHEPAAGPYSVCMHRGDAGTVSFTNIRVGEKHASIEYLAGAPCVPGAEVFATQIPLRASSN
jgi:hypothetical protein